MGTCWGSATSEPQVTCPLVLQALPSSHPQAESVTHRGRPGWSLNLQMGKLRPRRACGGLMLHQQPSSDLQGDALGSPGLCTGSFSPVIFISVFSSPRSEELPNVILSLVFHLHRALLFFASPLGQPPSLRRALFSPPTEHIDLFLFSVGQSLAWRTLLTGIGSGRPGNCSVLITESVKPVLARVVPSLLPAHLLESGCRWAANEVTN